jgi:hypothetical protein
MDDSDRKLLVSMAQKMAIRTNLHSHPMKRTIAVITSSRADYRHFCWPLRELAAHGCVDLKLIALGSHLAPEFGNTVQEIEKDGFRIDTRIECLLSSDTDVRMANPRDDGEIHRRDSIGTGSGFFFLSEWQRNCSFGKYGK